ncbi:MAG: hypothetical protein E6K79_10555 [Candidatus Eisenbacteria bacterium]|uniref:Uncharacterized protein n=1 Tax=Eiseniibacteriota bacterium TaxID=2212470 RepID=A0A538THI6_UNCEI|nr:MAG: hypothetical protein E6K79_10555 [Candidatus Eisenbacteria bacterium]
MTPTRVGVALAVGIAAVATASALLAPSRRPAATRAPAANGQSGIDNPPNPNRNVRAASAAARQGPMGRRVTGSASGIALPRLHSPLERSPGYYPPDDPESMSVITGHRDAPLVDLELTGGGASIDQLGRMLVAGINARDEAALHALGVTRKEFEIILWREFPESRPITHITADDAWEMASIQSHAGVSRTAGSFGGRNLEFIRIDCGPPIPYRNFTLHRQVEIATKDPSTSQEVRLNFAPSFVERHGRFKVLTFKD